MYSKRKSEWIKVDQDELKKILRSNLNSASLRVLLGLVSSLKYDNHSYLTIPQLSQITEVSNSTVKRSLAELRKFGHIAKLRKGRKNAYMVNPKLIFKGKSEDLPLAIGIFQSKVSIKTTNIAQIIDPGDSFENEKGRGDVRG